MVVAIAQTKLHRAMHWPYTLHLDKFLLAETPSLHEVERYLGWEGSHQHRCYSIPGGPEVETATYIKLVLFLSDALRHEYKQTLQQTIDKQHVLCERQHTQILERFPAARILTMATSVER